MRGGAACGGSARQAHAAAAAGAGGALADQLDAGGLQRADQLHQGIDVAAHHAVARLHALDGRQGQAGQFGQLALVDAQQRAGGPHLAGGDHGVGPHHDVWDIIIQCETFFLTLQP